MEGMRQRVMEVLGEELPTRKFKALFHMLKPDLFTDADIDAMLEASGSSSSAADQPAVDTCAFLDWVLAAKATGRDRGAAGSGSHVVDAPPLPMLSRALSEPISPRSTSPAARVPSLQRAVTARRAGAPWSRNRAAQFAGIDRIDDLQAAQQGFLQRMASGDMPMTDRMLLRLTRATSKGIRGVAEPTEAELDNTEEVHEVEVQSAVEEEPEPIVPFGQIANASAGVTALGSCEICFEDERMVTSLCGRKECKSRFCVECVRRHAETMIDDALYAMPWLKCPGCRARVSTQVWSTWVSEEYLNKYLGNGEALLNFRCPACHEPSSLFARTVDEEERSAIEQTINEKLKGDDVRARFDGLWPRFARAEQRAEDFVAALADFLVDAVEAPPEPPTPPEGEGAEEGEEEEEHVDEDVQGQSDEDGRPEAETDAHADAQTDAQADGEARPAPDVFRQRDPGRPPPAVKWAFSNDGCLPALIIDPERRCCLQLAMLRRYPKMRTPCCDEQFCFKCKIRDWHKGQSCEARQREEMDMSVQFCHRCGVPTVKSEGCDHIVCVCGASWHWQQSRLTNIIEANRVDALRELLNEGFDINAPDETTGETLLYMAARAAKGEVVTFLLDRRADASGAHTTQGSTVLEAALADPLSDGALQVVELLLAGRADPNQPIEDERTPLYSIVRTFAGGRGSLESEDTYFETKEKENMVPMVNLLIDARANVEASQLPLLEAMQNRCNHIARAIVERCRNIAPAILDASDTSGNTPLYLAVSNNHLDMVRLLLDSRASVNLVGPENTPPLHLAVRSQKLDMIAALLESSASANLADQDGCNALHCAMKADLHLEVGGICAIERLVDEVDDVDALTGDGETALLIAATNHINVDGLKVLLPRARVDTIVKGHTALAFAAQWCRDDAVELLLESEADAEARSSTNAWTPLHCIASTWSTNPSWQKPPPRATRLRMVERLLEARADVDAQSSGGSTPLLIACCSRANKVSTAELEQTLSLLLEVGADVSRTDFNGMSPFVALMQMATHGRSAIPTLLLYLPDEACLDGTSAFEAMRDAIVRSASADTEIFEKLVMSVAAGLISKPRQMLEECERMIPLRSQSFILDAPAGSCVEEAMWELTQSRLAVIRQALRSLEQA